MARSLMVGRTDYSNQSFKDMVSDLKQWVRSLKETKKSLENIMVELDKVGYFKNMPFKFIGQINWAIKFFTTSVNEIRQIKKEISYEVRPDHVNRLGKLAEKAKDFFGVIGSYWNREYPEDMKNYKNTNFKMIEDLYIKSREMAGDMLDLNNLSHRLKDFIGKKKKEFTKQWWWWVSITVVGGVIVYLILSIFSIGQIKINWGSARPKNTKPIAVIVSYESDSISKSDAIKVRHVLKSAEDNPFKRITLKEKDSIWYDRYVPMAGGPNNLEIMYNPPKDTQKVMWVFWRLKHSMWADSSGKWIRPDTLPLNKPNEEVKFADVRLCDQLDSLAKMSGFAAVAVIPPYSWYRDEQPE